jgi:hypothetical protein
MLTKKLILLTGKEYGIAKQKFPLLPKTSE